MNPRVTLGWFSFAAAASCLIGSAYRGRFLDGLSLLAVVLTLAGVSLIAHARRRMENPIRSDSNQSEPEEH